MGEQAHELRETGMHSPDTNIHQMIEQLNQFQVPCSLMECFDAYREEAMKADSQTFGQSQLAWFLDLMNRFRGPYDSKQSLLDVFDPGMFTCDHPAWNAPPGTRIEMPALTSEVAELALGDSEFAQIAKAQIREFRKEADSYADDEILGLANIAHAALADRRKVFHGREDAMRYVALNASAELEDLWACDDTLWKTAPVRVIEFDDMVAKKKAALLKMGSVPSLFQERDLSCYSEEEIRTFAFDMRKLFLTDRAKHLAVCTRCQHRLEHWTGLVEKFDQATPPTDRRPDA